MFWKNFKVELMRAFRPARFFAVVALIVVLLFVSDWRTLEYFFSYGRLDSKGIIDQFQYLLGIDAFKCIMVIALCALYTSSFCKDDNSRYLRMILARTDVTTYIQCRFLANFCVIVGATVIAFLTYTLCMLPIFPLVGNVGIKYSCYYIEFAEGYPMLYVLMICWVFALAASACSSIGLLYSSYDSNSFVSIAAGGFLFYMGLSYIPRTSIFSFLELVGMQNMLGGLWASAPKWVNFLWTNIYMLSVTGVCSLLFWRRMKWRVDNGYV